MLVTFFYNVCFTLVLSSLFFKVTKQERNVLLRCKVQEPIPSRLLLWLFGGTDFDLITTQYLWKTSCLVLWFQWTWTTLYGYRSKFNYLDVRAWPGPRQTEWYKTCIHMITSVHFGTCINNGDLIIKHCSQCYICMLIEMSINIAASAIFACWLSINIAASAIFACWSSMKHCSQCFFCMLIEHKTLLPVLYLHVDLA